MFEPLGNLCFIYLKRFYFNLVFNPFIKAAAAADDDDNDDDDNDGDEDDDMMSTVSFLIRY